MKAILFPSSSYDTQKIDQSFKREYDAALQSKLFDIILFDSDKWFDENILALNRSFEGKTIYRGWMMKPMQYESFYLALKDKNIFLSTSPDEYNHFHLFPNVYSEFGTDTAKMFAFPEGQSISFETIKQTFDKFMIKDYVKSVKETDFPKYFITSDLTEDEFNHWIQVFCSYRRNRFVGGICIKQYLELKSYDGHFNEYRIFVANNSIVSISRNSGQDATTPEPPVTLYQKYITMKSPFYTIDVSELQDGSWKIIEAGDGSVSGLSDWQDYDSFFRSLYYAFQ